MRKGQAAPRTAPELLAWLESRGTRRNVEGLARYGIATTRAFGVPIAPLLRLAKQIGKDHELAAALWKSGWYEARLLATMIDDPDLVTARQMDAWARDFDNWGICDTACWHLFDKTDLAWRKAREWSQSPREYVKRAAFAMMAGQAGHNKDASDAEFLALLPLIEEGARDERNFVKKAVSWALRRIGGRSRKLHDASVATAKRLAASENASCRWVGKDALRAFASPAHRARVARSR